MLKYILVIICVLSIIFNPYPLSHASATESMIRAGLFKNNNLVGLEINKEHGREIMIALTNLLLQYGYKGCPNEQSFNEVLDTIKSTGGTYIFVRISEIQAGGVAPSKDYFACSVDRFIIKEGAGHEIISGGNAILLIPKKESPYRKQQIEAIFSEIIKLENIKIMR